MSHDPFNQTTYFNSAVVEAENISASMCLTIFDASSEPVVLNLADSGKGLITFGRDEGNDIVIRSKYVSRRHGQFRFAYGRWLIENLQSTNGLIHGGAAIESKYIDDGDSIRIDDGVETTVDGVLLVFSSETQAQWHNFVLDGRPASDITIGRSPECSLFLDHISVSKVHAVISERNGEFWLADNGSTNGVTINGRKVAGRVKLFEKDLILITNSKIIFSKQKISYCCFKYGVSVDGHKVQKRVQKNKIICNDVDINIKPGEMVAIVGGSGAGKSTLMNCLCGYSRPTGGTVTVNGIDLYENFNTVKNIIGYVPQSDIVYDNLTVFDMLKYTAKLRLPSDISERECSARIAEVIAAVELTQHKDTLIRSLSGGQRKRASIAVELLSDPNLFFLDEPASGLDPGTERNLVKTLKTMTSSGKTVIFVTHSTLNLHLCDKIAFMGAGGLLCFYGSYADALRFFGVDDVVDVYNLITYETKRWHDHYTAHATVKPGGSKAASEFTKTIKREWHEQMPVLFKRNLHIMANDRVRLLLIILQAPLLALLISLVADGYQFEDHRITKSLLFALSCSAFWIGILNSIQEVCKERNILKREYMTCLRLDAYILAKILVMAVICAVQSLLLVVVFALLVGLPDYGVIFVPFIELLITTFLTSLAASAMGLFVSSMFKNADRAMTVAPLLLMPQLLFSGMIFALEGVSEIISYIAVCRWSMEGFGTTADLNALETRLKDKCPITGRTSIVNDWEAFYDFTAGHQILTWCILFAFVAIFSVVAVLVLRNINKER